MAPGVDIPRCQIENTTITIPNQSLKEPTITIESLTTTPITPTQQTNTTTLVLHPTFITTDFDLLRFHAAAHDQLPKPSTAIDHQIPTSDSPAYSTNLISSPYNNAGHYLDLTTLPLPSLLFAKALTALKPRTPEYATAEYTEALNFDEVREVLRNLVAAENKLNGFSWPKTSFYAVVFRSQLKEGTDNDYLYKLDYESHREACESGGLLKYWFGAADSERRNLATCFWHSREDAYKGGLGPWHVKARRAGRELYETIVFSTWRFVVEEGGREWRIEE
ncbi:hypothetical protein EK21DRAFT_99935 [Setomelanomma holmii]|uniref:Uncharacterized protein n=1 Tax=Setomelanomma holmii TaxID=210430 RepID=A0A9P4HCP5_9PLEO|nr:hypothetical protein EK21DRAFT_99935 [Setomelanomma holmii]